jgi:hypothetical protein
LTQSVVNYFISSNSAKGYVSFFQSNFGGLDSVFRLGGYPSIVMSDLLSGICDRAQEEGFHPELIHNCMDNSLEGLIVPERKTGILNAPLYDEKQYYVAGILNDENLTKTRAFLASASKHLAEALKIHNGWETIYISNMDFSAADQYTEEIIQKLIGKRQFEGKGTAVDRFFGSLTVDGSFDYIENLTAGIQKRYLIKGQPGTGKSLFLKKLSKRAVEAGLHTEIYHCAFNPQNIDMIILNELDLCLFDSTPPHEYFPSRPNDEIIDFCQASLSVRTDDKYRTELAAITSDYKEEIAKAVKQLGKAKRYYDEVQQSYLSKLNAQVLAIVEEQIQNTIFE